MAERYYVSFTGIVTLIEITFVVTIVKYLLSELHICNLHMYTSLQSTLQVAMQLIYINK
jgi:hypothetical protein